VTSIEALAFDYQPYFENLTVAGNATTVVVVSMVALGNGTLSLTVTPGSATLWVDTLREPLTGGAYSAAVSVGTHLVEVLAPGYYPYFNNVTVAKASTIQLVVSLIPVSSGSSSSGPFGISTSGWVVIALVSALAVVFLIGMVYYARRPRGRAPSPAVAPTQPWQESPPDPPSS